MKHYIFLFLSLISFSVIFSQNAGEIRISGSYQKKPLTFFFEDVEKQTNIKFFYKPEWFKNDTINENYNAVLLTDVLNKITEHTSYTYRILQNNYIVFLPKEDVLSLLGRLNNFANLNNEIGNVITVGSASEIGKEKQAVIKGKIIDGRNNEPIAGAFIVVDKTNIATQSNSNGQFNLNLSPGIYTLNISSVGYESTKYNVKVLSSGSINFELFEKSTKIEEVTIYAQRPDKNVRSNQMSMIELDSKSIKQLPSLTGSKDILKSFTLMPGVKSVGEFGSGINIRGGGEDQNLYLIEGTPIFNTSHVLGLMSVLNPDAVTGVTLYKGQIPAYYGERIASVVDIQLRDNSIDQNTTKGGIGIYDARLMNQGKINENFTYKLGGRSSYSNWLLRQIPDMNIQNSRASFYDANLLLNYRRKNDRFILFYYQSHNWFNYNNLLAYKYNNYLASINWMHYFNENLSSSLLLSQSIYHASKDNFESEYEKFSFQTQVNYTTARYNVHSTKLSNHTFDAGINLINYVIHPGKINPYDTVSLISPANLKNEQGIEAAIYINDLWNITENWSISPGIRISGFGKLGNKTIYRYNELLPRNPASIIDSIEFRTNQFEKKYYGIEPRISVRYQLNSQTSFKASYNRNIQYISQLSYSSIPAPTDIWKLSDYYIKPAIANQFAIGLFRNNQTNTIESSIELYYKKIENLVEIKNNTVVEMNNTIEQDIVNTNGTNYGVEFMLKKNKGKIDGWISYTYSRSLRKSNDDEKSKINNGSWYPSSYDKPHDLSIYATYHINKRWRISANFNYSTGRPISLPEYSYQIDSKNQVVVFSDRNKYRLPDYHRLDLAISMDESLYKRKKWKGSWTLSVLNVYGRKNTYSVYYKKDKPDASNNYNVYSLYKLYLIGIPFPTLTYNFVF